MMSSDVQHFPKHTVDSLARVRSCFIGPPVGYLPQAVTVGFTAMTSPSSYLIHRFREFLIDFFLCLVLGVAHDWKGTFNQSQFNRFVAFARAQKADLAGRINHLAAEQLRIGTISFAYDSNGVPTTFVPDDESYIAKLVAAYEVLGGDPFFDLNIRSKSQAVFLRAGDENTPAQVLSNGEIMGLPGQADAESAELMDNARGWIEDALDYKRAYLERKIRRAVDYAEQLQDEITYLTLVASAADTEGSFENVYQAITALIGDPAYRAIYDDKGKDPMGKKVNAPFKPYSAGPDRAPDDLYGRDNTGALDPGETVE